jgi:hypothetical protein
MTLHPAFTLLVFNHGEFISAPITMAVPSKP